MGNNKKALHLVIEELMDVEKVYLMIIEGKKNGIKLSSYLQCVRHLLCKIKK
jgi:hypothetical protein